MDFQSAVIALFFILNGLGNIPLFAGLLSRYPEARQKQIIARELLIAFFILLSFAFLGKEILGILGIGRGVLEISGGLILMIIAVGMLFPKPQTVEATEAEPFIVPMAFPLLAGAGSMTNVMALGANTDSALKLLGVIFAAWFLTALLLVWSSQLKNFLGSKGMVACEKLGGLVIVLISVQMLTTGLARIVADLFMLQLKSPTI
ncbi:MarC family protein [bacterium]|nr:MarC family protein [Chlamydiota bacterium]NDD99713.1 MarC family protein [bacterium]